VPHASSSPRAPRSFVFIAVVGSLAGCSLTTSLEGLTGGDGVEETGTPEGGTPTGSRVGSTGGGQATEASVEDSGTEMVDAAASGNDSSTERDSSTEIVDAGASGSDASTQRDSGGSDSSGFGWGDGGFGW
jgi:hypothetical protein